MRNILKRYGAGLVCCVVAAALLGTGCATIVSGTRQEIPINSEPSGAKVTVVFEKKAGMGESMTRAHTQVGDVTKERIEFETPLVITVPRNVKTVTIRIQKEGYFPQQVILARTSNGWLWGNLFFGGLLGIGIDFLTGAAYELSPSQVDSILTELNTSGSLGLLSNGDYVLVLSDLSQGSVTTTRVKWRHNSVME